MDNLTCIKAHKYENPPSHTLASDLIVTPEHVFVLDSVSMGIISHSRFSDSPRRIPLEGIVLLGYNPDLESVTVLTKDGQFKSWNLQEEEEEVLAVMNSSVLCMEWSANGQYLACVTLESELAVYTSLFQKLFAIKLPSCSLSEESVVSVSWKSDSNKVMVNYPNDEMHRSLSVIDIEMKRIVANNSSISGLEAVFDWNFSLNMAAAVTSTEDSTKITLIEPNTLPHGEFPLSNPNSTVISIKWNANAEILGVLVKDELQLWTCRNYKWDLKRTIPVPGVKNLCWDPESIFTLFLLFESAQVIEFCFIVDISLSNEKTVIVIDDNSARTTDFSHAVIPPPLSENIIDLPSSILCCSVDSEGNVSFLLDNGRVESYDPNDGSILLHGQLNGLDLALVREILVYRGNHVIVLVESDKLFEWEITDSDTTKFNQYTLPKHCSRLFSSKLPDRAFLQLEDGKICVISSDGISDHGISLPRKCTNLIDLGNGVILGYSSTHLYLNETLIRSDVTSFCPTLDDKHVIVTTYTGELLIVSILTKEVVSDSRTIEKTEKLVCAPGINCILQHPRGNLETIVSRHLLLISVKKYLNKEAYREAYSIMRVHRVDTNLLIDHDPEKAERNAVQIVRALERSEDLNLFISAISDKDVTTTTFSHFYDGKNVKKSKKEVGKYLSVFRKALESVGKDKYIIPILSTFIRGDKPDIVSALVYMWREFSDNMRILEEGVSYLVLLLSEEQIFRGALETCDLRLARSVVSLLEKDPKEITPIIEDFEAISHPGYRKYSILRYLSKNEDAMLALVDCGEEYVDELVVFVEKFPKLLSATAKAVELLPDKFSKKNLDRIHEAYANHLRESSQLLDAGNYYLSASNYALARQCFEESIQWKLCLYSMKASNCQESEIKQVGLALIDRLKQVGKHEEAGRVFVVFRGEIEEGVRSMCEGNAWERAMEYMSLYNRLDLLELVMCPMLRYAGDSTVNEIGDKIVRLTRINQRLVEVREKTSIQPFIDLPHTKGKTGKKRAPKQSQEISLVNTIANEIPNTAKQNEIHSLIRALILTGESSLCRKLQQSFGEFMTTLCPIWEGIIRRKEEVVYENGYMEYRIEKGDVPLLLPWKEVCNI